MTDKEETTTTGQPSQQQLDDAEKQAREMDELYEPGARPSVVVPGTDGTLAGTAFADSVDDPEAAVNQSNRPPKEVPGHSTPANLYDEDEPDRKPDDK